MLDQATLLNQIVNRPEVLSKVAPGYKYVDLTPFFNDPRNVMLGDERGAIIFVWRRPFTYELHYLLTDALRGRAAFHAAAAAIRTLFTCTDALAIVGSTPRDNRAARAMNRALGAVPTGVSTDSQGRECVDYLLERSTWATSSVA